MAMGVKHYSKNGKEHKGSTHKHPDGTLMAGKTMSSTSQKLRRVSATKRRSK